jgi:hypothetical protein
MFVGAIAFYLSHVFFVSFTITLARSLSSSENASFTCIIFSPVVLRKKYPDPIAVGNVVDVSSGGSGTVWVSIIASCSNYSYRY